MEPKRTATPLERNVIANLKVRRTKMGFSQARIAELLGIQQPTYAQYETGRRAVLLSTLEKFAKLYRCSVHDLIDPPPSLD